MDKHKKLAICFFGCARTYEKTYKNFFKFIVEPNQKDGWEIDIFIHTWDVFEKSGFAWHNNSFPSLDNKKLSDEDILHIKSIYDPKRICVEHLGDCYGAYKSKKKLAEVVLDYEQKQNIKYQYYITTRMDILFCTPFRIDMYLNLYDDGKVNKLKLPNKHIFTPFNPFVRMPVIDSRYINEGSLICASNFIFEGLEPEGNPGSFVILVNYLLYQDFFLQRENFIYGLARNKAYQKKLLDTKIQALTEENKKLIRKIFSAKRRIKNHLAYKLGQAMIFNSKSFLGYIRMPYVLSYIKAKHKAEQKDYETKIAKNPNLKLPKLESYDDYKEALKIQSYFSYKLGSALIKRNKEASNNIFKFALTGGGLWNFYSKTCLESKKNLKKNQNYKYQLKENLHHQKSIRICDKNLCFHFLAFSYTNPKKSLFNSCKARAA